MAAQTKYQGTKLSKRLLVTLTPEQLKDLKLRAKKEKRTVCALVREALGF